MPQCAGVGARYIVPLQSHTNCSKRNLDDQTPQAYLHCAAVPTEPHCSGTDVSRAPSASSRGHRVTMAEGSQLPLLPGLIPQSQAFCCLRSEEHTSELQSRL